MDDIDILQLCKNKTICDKAVKLFLRKWKSQERFLEYFSDEWLGSKSGWYEGLEVNVPSTNNALEATNRYIKDEDTIRERLPLSRSTVVVFSIVNKWSKERNPTHVNAKKIRTPTSNHIPILD
jgi:hypothetical protein